jgi:hypothetical protein
MVDHDRVHPESSQESEGEVVTGKRIPLEVKEHARRLLGQGLSQAEVWRMLDAAGNRISKRSITDLADGLPKGVKSRAQLQRFTANPPRSWGQLDDVGKRALQDFSFFSETFFLRDVPPWRAAAARTIVEALLDPEERYVILNVAVGSGKSSLLRDVVAWVVSGGGSCDPGYGRSLRVLLGHAVYDKAEQSVDLLRQLFESSVPYYDSKKRLSASTRLLEAYGRFRSSPSDDDGFAPWRQNKFKVASVEDAPVFNKEPTVQAISYDSTFVGERGDLIVLDDIVSLKNLADPDFVAWMESVEDRLEPGGLIVMLGQRVGVQDGYEQVLGRTWDAEESDVPVPIYTHISWPAHNAETCDGNHRQWDLEADGCLLDERRLPWRKLQRESGKPSFTASYQQRPEERTGGLVSNAHIYGGTDATGYESPGCLDADRMFGQHPKEIDGLLDFITVDTAVTAGPKSGYWAVEWWAVHPRTRRSWLIEGHRRKMTGSDFLDLSSDGHLEGFMFDLQLHSIASGHAVRAFVIESNRADWLSSNAFDMFHRSFPNVAVITPRTGVNKTDKAFGIEAKLQNRYRIGAKRLPWMGEEARGYVRTKIEELTQWPYSRHDDTVMADWLGELKLDEVIAAGSGPHLVPNIDVGHMPDYLRRQRQEQKPPRRDRRAALGHYAGGESHELGGVLW